MTQRAETHLVSVDPGDPCAWFLWTPDEYRDRTWLVRRFGSLSGFDAATVYLLLARLGMTRPAERWHLAIEDQWYAEPDLVCVGVEQEPGGKLLPLVRKRYRSAHWRSAKLLLLSRAWWEAAFRILGGSVELIPARRWIPAMTRGIPERTSRARIRVAAEARWQGVARLRGEEPAAALLGEYWIVEHGGTVARGGAPRRGERLEGGRIAS